MKRMLVIALCWGLALAANAALTLADI